METIKKHKNCVVFENSEILMRERRHTFLHMKNVFLSKKFRILRQNEEGKNSNIMGTITIASVFV